MLQRGHCRTWDNDTITYIMTIAVILHNMIIENNEQGRIRRLWLWSRWWCGVEPRGTSDAIYLCWVNSCVYIMRLKTKRCMRGSVIIWWSICGHIMVCRSVVVFDMHIVLVSLVDVDNLTFEFWLWKFKFILCYIIMLTLCWFKLCKHYIVG